MKTNPGLCIEPPQSNVWLFIHFLEKRGIETEMPKSCSSITWWCPWCLHAVFRHEPRVSGIIKWVLYQMNWSLHICSFLFLWSQDLVQIPGLLFHPERRREKHHIFHGGVGHMQGKIRILSGELTILPGLYSFLAIFWKKHFSIKKSVDFLRCYCSEKPNGKKGRLFLEDLPNRFCTFWRITELL